MSQAVPPTLSPPIDAVVEKEFVYWDYVNILAEGETIVGTPVITCVVFSGTDADANDRLIGAAVIRSSPSCPDRADSAVAQLFGTCIAGVTYRLQCVAETSDGQFLSLYVDFPCQSTAP